jgi:hypothetical protein
MTDTATEAGRAACPTPPPLTEAERELLLRSLFGPDETYEQSPTSKLQLQIAAVTYSASPLVATVR